MEKNKENIKKDIPRTMMGFVRFIFSEIISQKRWLLLPLWLLLASIALFLFLVGTSPLLPAIYIAF